MGILLAEEREFIKVISRIDDSVNCTDDEYNEYLKTLDENYLGLSDDSLPVRFVLKTKLNYKEVRQIKKDQVAVTEAGMGVNVGFTMLDVRLSLVDIENPSHPRLNFRKGKDGLADEELISLLDSLGIVSDLYQAKQNCIKPPVSKKN